MKFESAIQFVIQSEQGGLITASDFAERIGDNPSLQMWQYLDATFHPAICRCTYTCVWRAFEAFYDTRCLEMTEIEDRANACIKWLHEMRTKVERLEAVNDLVSPSPFSKHRRRFAELKQRADEITELVMHKLRCEKFGV